MAPLLKSVYGHETPFTHSLFFVICFFLTEGTAEDILWIIIKTDSIKWNGRILVSFIVCLDIFLINAEIYWS